MLMVMPPAAWVAVAILGAWLLWLPDPVALVASVIVFVVGLVLAFRK